MAAAATANASGSVVPRNRNGPGGRNGPVDDDSLVFETSPGVEAVTSFDQMGIRDDLLRGIYAYGFEKPSAIQQRAVMPIINGRDVIAQAQSGTGKTSMIALTVCQMIDTSTREYYASLLSPSLCLSVHIHDDLFCLFYIHLSISLGVGDMRNPQISPPLFWM